MLEAAGWGLVGGAALVVGALVGLRFDFPLRWVGLVMAFGAGVLISAVAFDLTHESFERGGHDAVAAGLGAGALVYFGGDWVIDNLGGEHRKRSGGQQAGGNAMALLLGAVLDGIPESFAIGVSLLQGSGVGVAFVAAVFISNVPEALSSATGMRRAGSSALHVLGIWSAVTLVSGLAAAIGFALMDGVSDDVIAFIQAFAAGAILTMLADTMMPEAFEDSGAVVGLATVLGFTLAFFLTTFE